MHHCRECFRPKGHFVTLSSHMSVQLVNVTSETTFLTNSFETEVEALTSQGITFSLCPESCWHLLANIFPYIPSSSLTWADHAPFLAARDHNFVQIGKGGSENSLDVTTTKAVFSMRAGKPAHEFSFLCDCQAWNNLTMLIG